MAASATLNSYRASIWGSPDPLMRRALKTSAAVGGVVLLAVWLAPEVVAPPPTVDEVPERLAKLILQEAPPVPVSPLPALPEVVLDTPMPEPAVAEPVVEKAAPAVRRPARRTPTRPEVAADAGQAGRQRAQRDVQQQLATVTGSLQGVVSDLKTALASTDDGAPTRKDAGSRRRTRRGRGVGQLASVGGGVGSGGGGVLGAAGGTGIAIESIQGLAWEGSTAGDGGGASQADGASPYRSNQSLLAVVRRYAPGIQFCYDNELKRNATLGGKLIISVTIAASGQVTNAAVVSDSVGSAALTACALAQVEAWRFPAIPEGVVLFQAPFVFTPPS